MLYSRRGSLPSVKSISRSLSNRKIVILIFLLSDCLSFAGLLLAYGILRVGQTTWHHPGETILGINFTAVLNFLLIF